MTASGIIILIGGILNISIGFFVLLKDVRNPLYRTFFVMIFGIGMWSIGFAMINFTQSLGIANIITLWGSIIVIGGLWNFSKYFPHKNKTIINNNLLTHSPLIALILLVPFGLIIQDASFSSGFPEPVNGPLFNIYALILLVYLSASLFNLFTTFKKSNSNEKNRMLYFLLAIGIFFILAVIFDVILPAIGIFQFNAIGPASTLIISIATTYAILRHNLMNIKVIIQRGVIYLIILGLIVGTYLGLLGLIHLVSHSITSEYEAALIGILVTIIGIITVPKIDHYLRHITDKIFFKGAYNYEKALLRLGHNLHELVFIADIKKEISERLSQIFRAESCVLKISNNINLGTMNNEFIIHEQKKHLYIPIQFKNRLLATIIMGPKKSGDAYTVKDQQLLQTFSYHIATACEKARLYDEVYEYSQNLEKKVAERTKEIEKIQQDQEKMMMDLTHNLQTPLTVLKSELALLNKNKEIMVPDTFFSFERSLDSVSSFIKRLLHLSSKRMSNQKELEKMDLSQCLVGISEYLRTITEDDEIIYTDAIEPGIEILGQVEEIEELITNLVSNAIKYRDPQRVGEIKLTAHTQEQYAVIQVIDNGIGITQENIKSIFERFYRAPNNSIGGNGLGLAICKRITERHKGTIHVESIPGEGSTFAITIPLST